MRSNRQEDLFHIVFKGRNQEYGGYILRKLYPRNLTISLILGVFLIAALVLIPFIYYYFEPIPLLDDDMIMNVEYYSVLPPPDNDLNKLAGSLPKQPEEQQAPVVTDSVVEQKLKPVEEHPPVDEEAPSSDTAGKGPGNVLGGKGEGDANGLMTVIDVYPKYPGGDDARLWFLRKNVRYPQAALNASIQGVVVVVFVIEIDGSLSHIEVSKAIGGGCDEEAIRVIKLMPRWEPARRAGKPVRVVVKFPIVFNRAAGR
ncbi:MAG: TonB family protein [Bacteroidetes bacterium]|nr:TonB family protein [Bacteroidota bacterium]